METNIISKDWLTTKEAVGLTNYSQEYVRELARDGKVVSTKIGHSLMISKSSLLEYYSKQEGKR